MVEHIISDKLETPKHKMAVDISKQTETIYHKMVPRYKMIDISNLSGSTKLKIVCDKKWLVLDLDIFQPLFTFHVRVLFVILRSKI